MKNLFENISLKHIEKIQKLLNIHTVNYQEKIDISQMINSKDTIVFIKSGSISILKQDYNGNKIKVDELYENESFISNMSYILDEDYKIITLEPTTILIINTLDILSRDYLKYPYFNTLIKNLYSIIDDKMKQKNERIEILTKKSIRDKLLEYFKIMSRKNGSKVIYLPFGFTDLADYIAVDRSAMSRELKYLKEEGLISITGKRITLEYIKR